MSEKNEGDPLSHVETLFQLPAGTFPYESKFVKLGGHQLHYVDEGNGPVLLMLHGNPSWSFLYRHMIKLLKKHYRCIAVDYPGFGLSKPAPGYRFLPEQHSQLVEEFVDRLDLKELTLFVQDWGGPIGLGIAGRRPNLIRKIVITNSFAWPERQLFVRAFARILGGPLGRLFIKGLDSSVAKLMSVGVEKPLSAELLRAYRGPFPDWSSREGVAVFIRENVNSKNYLERVEKGLEKLAEKPVLLLWGDKEFTAKYGHMERFEELLPQAQARILDGGVGHFCQEDAPERVCNHIREWDRE